MLFELWALAEANTSPVQDAVEEVGDIIEHAGDRAGNLLTNLPEWPEGSALSILDAHAHNMNAHQSLRAMLEGNPVFEEKLENCSRKYVLSRR